MKVEIVSVQGDVVLVLPEIRVAIPMSPMAAKDLAKQFQEKADIAIGHRVEVERLRRFDNYEEPL